MTLSGKVEEVPELVGASVADACAEVLGVGAPCKG